jgi:methylated-DNA-[protein]-cysteine S-methyltransferase
MNKSITDTLRKTGHAEISERLEALQDSFVKEADDAGLVDVAYCSIDSPVGPLLLAGTNAGLATVSFVRDTGDDHALEELAARLSPRVVKAPGRLDDARRELDEYFEGRRTTFDVPLDWQLISGFGRKVLRATARIPYGKTSSYQRIAAAAGSPSGSRAAGNALGANPLPIVVPCHRVLRTGGAIGGYGGGLERKEWLLRLEGVL